MSRLGSLEAEPETRIWRARLTDWGSALRSEGSKTVCRGAQQGRMESPVASSPSLVTGGALEHMQGKISSD